MTLNYVDVKHEMTCKKITFSSQKSDAQFVFRPLYILRQMF